MAPGGWLKHLASLGELSPCQVLAGEGHCYIREETSSILLMLYPRTTEILVSYCRWVNQSMKTPVWQVRHLQDIVQGLQPWDYES